MKTIKLKLPIFSRAFFKSKRAWALFLIILALLAGVFFGLKYYNERKADQRQNEELIQKVESLNKGDIPCNEVVKQIGDENAEKYNDEAKRKLLDLQLNCQAVTGDKDKSLKAAQELKELYEKEGDEYRARLMEMTVNNINSKSEPLEYE